MDIEKRLNILEQRLDKLESKSSNFNAFGKSYSQVGSSTSDFLIKTRGQVKIQWGNKFIDLIKNGEINCNPRFIYQSDEVGDSDGIYVLNSGEVVLVSDSQQINLLGQIDLSGIIVMYNKPEEIPENWSICDGTNNTPDLTDKFIMNEDGSYALVYIMKIK